MPAARMVNMEQFGVAALALVAGTTALPVELALFENSPAPKWGCFYGCQAAMAGEFSSVRCRLRVR
jgi:hypothetical protein